MQIKRKSLKRLNDEELREQFAWISSECIPSPLVDIHFKKNDKKNIDKIIYYRDVVASYTTCIRELKSRGYTLQEIMSIKK